MRGRIIIGGALAQKPCQAGHTWQFLQYLIGFRRLGWDVLFVDHLEEAMCVDEHGQPCSFERSVNRRYLLQVMEQFGLINAFAVMRGDGREFFGRSRSDVLDFARSSEFLLNFMGYVRDPDILDAVPLRVFLDTDPGFPQMWQDLGLHDPFLGHDAFVTIAEHLGKPGCTIPTCGRTWITTPQPVLLEEWKPREIGGDFITGIGAWRGPYGPVEYKGTTYGLRVHEFRKFFELPARSGARFQVAFDIHAAETRDLEQLERNGWALIDPIAATGDPLIYRDYIAKSRAEFMVAKGMYVQSRSGWFSERSMCYLASGKPVIAQDTGLRGLYPLGDGLLTFTTLDEATAAVLDLQDRYPRHCQAARALAEKYFDSDKVLGRLVERLACA